MKTVLWIGLGIVVAVVLVVVGLGVGWGLWGRSLWAAGPFTAPEMAASTPPAPGYGRGGYRVGRGMMAEGTVPGAPCGDWGYGAGPSSALTDTLTIEHASEAAERYVAILGYSDLEVAEVMEFERNFYAIVRESDTGIGAMELLVDRWTGEVGPEMGPNMMWNARYGMHGRSGHMGMRGGAGEFDTVMPDEALRIAQRWLDTYRPGVTVEGHAAPFYGYYTVHTLRDGEVEGMLSVHGTTSQVWYHTWHGDFIRMIGGEEGEDH